MEATIEYSKEELARVELRKFLDEGLRDISNNQLLDFDETFGSRNYYHRCQS